MNTTFVHLLGHCAGLKLPNTFSSYIDASAMNKKYQTIRMTPRRLSSFHPFKCTDNSKNTTVDSSDNVEYVKPRFKVFGKCRNLEFESLLCNSNEYFGALPLEITLTWPPASMIVVWMSHGKPRQIRMSNTLEPTAFETAISPYPSLITAIELNASGIDTPAATNVRPISNRIVF